MLSGLLKVPSIFVSFKNKEINIHFIFVFKQNHSSKVEMGNRFKEWSPIVNPNGSVFFEHLKLPKDIFDLQECYPYHGK